VRETLFNWLQAYLPGAHCLDLFAGSGVLGFEALSRGAHSVTFVERERAAFNVLQDNACKLDAADKVKLLHRDALDFIQSDDRGMYDIVFMDPPYGQGLVADCLQLFERYPCLKPGGLLYLEHESDRETPALPEKWLLLKNKTAGQVNYSLLRSL
jgi:16S rRNA (guanine966-N2)-methyltransferase